MGKRAGNAHRHPSSRRFCTPIRKISILRTSVIIAIAAISLNIGVAASAPLDYTLPNGRFFTQTNGSGGGGDIGYAVTDDDGVRFWSAFRQLGGVEIVGYPVSRRFQWNGFTVQAFQKLVLQWRPERNGVSFVNVFDELSHAAKDKWLSSFRATPEPIILDENGKSWEQIVTGRISLLDENPAIKTFYLNTPGYMDRYGLPTSRITDMGNAYVVRLQRAVLQQWKVDVPWAKARQVTVANGGDIGKEALLYPEDAIRFERFTISDPPQGSKPSNPNAIKVMIDPGHGGPEPGAIHRFQDGSVLYEKDVNLKVALKVGDELYKLGYQVDLTRRSDTRVNDGRDLNGDGRVTIEDDLQARVDRANAFGADIFVSIHHNGISDPNIRGTEVYYCEARPQAERSKKLATFVQEALVRALRGAGYNTVDRGAKTDSKALGTGRHYYLLGPKSRLVARPSNMPAIIGEGLFVSNDYEANLLRQDSFLTTIASAYVSAINRYFASEGR